MRETYMSQSPLQPINNLTDFEAHTHDAESFDSIITIMQKVLITYIQKVLIVYVVYLTVHHPDFDL